MVYSDVENEADLEKVRTRRLLREFKTYVEAAEKPKGRIKEARLEALRTGFKNCYQEKDFATISSGRRPHTAVATYRR